MSAAQTLLLLCAVVLALLVIPQLNRSSDNRSIARGYPDQSFNARYYREQAVGFEIQAAVLSVIAMVLAGVARSLN